MFSFFKKGKERKILSPQTGTIIPITEVPDEAFSEKMLGDGIAIIPDSDEIVSPVCGTVVQVSDTLHAYGIQSEDEVDVLIHVGLNTVELKGEGFTSFVKEGDKVKVGDIIAKADINLIKERGYPVHTPVLITNTDDLKEISFSNGKAEGGKTVIITYQK